MPHHRLAAIADGLIRRPADRPTMQTRSGPQSLRNRLIVSICFWTPGLALPKFPEQWDTRTRPMHPI